MIKLTFLQSLLSLSDSQFEVQLIDQLSFQRFVGIRLDQEIPDFTTFWRFKEALIAHGLEGRIFELINEQMEANGLLAKKGTMVDASILPSSGRPPSKEMREVLAEETSSQIDTDATSTRKGGTYYFGYKGHFWVDVESNLIQKAAITTANAHDSSQTERLIPYDEKALFGDKAYGDQLHKYLAIKSGWYYGVLDKVKRNHPCPPHKRSATIGKAVSWPARNTRSLG